MSLFAAFLRGMNVGGHRLTNDELRSHFIVMGFREVATFRASGNVVFAGESRSPDAVRARIEQGLEDALGYAVPAFIRSAPEMRAIASSRPFAEKLVRASSGRLQVALLTGEPSSRVREEILGLAGDGDRLSFGERELYWLPSGGVLDSPLDMKSIERALGAITMRTKNTIEQIADRHFAG